MRVEIRDNCLGWELQRQSNINKNHCLFRLGFMIRLQCFAMFAMNQYSLWFCDLIQSRASLYSNVLYSTFDVISLPYVIIR